MVGSRALALTVLLLWFGRPGSSDLYPKCACANASLCRPLAGPRPAKSVRVVSDCGGPTHDGCDWRAFDWARITEVTRQAGHQLLVSSDGAVSFNANPNVHSAHGVLRWPESELVCFAHAHGVRVLATVLPGILRTSVELANFVSFLN